MKIFFLSANSIAYPGPTNDGWFQATKEFPTTAARPGQGQGRVKIYYQDEPASPMGCVSQEQFCLYDANAQDGRRCTPLSGVVDSLAATTELFGSQSETMLQIFNWAFSAAFKWAPNIAGVVTGLGSQSLLAKFLITNGAAAQLPDNQWQAEVRHWHDVTLAGLQAFFVNTARGPSDPTVAPWLRRPNNTEENLLCRNQVSSSCQQCCRAFC